VPREEDAEAEGVVVHKEEEEEQDEGGDPEVGSVLERVRKGEAWYCTRVLLVLREEEEEEEEEEVDV
jgi:hypothetical protein